MKFTQLFYIVVFYLLTLPIIIYAIDVSTIKLLIRQLSLNKQIKLWKCFTCFNLKDTLVMYKYLSKILRISIQQSTSFFNGDKRENTYGRTQMGYLLDLSCENHRQLLHQVDNYNIFQSTFKWVMIDTTNNILTNHSSILQFFSNINLRIDSDVSILVNYNTLFDIYKSEFKVILSEIGQIKTLKYGFISHYNLDKYQHRKDLMGTTIKCGVVKTHNDDSPNLDAYYKRITRENFDTINKMSYNLFLHLVEIYNFTPKITVTDRWSGNSLSGVDDGLEKLLHENVVECGISPVIIKTLRIPFFDYIAPVYPFRTCFTFRNSRKSTKVQNELLKPFSNTVWYTLIGCIILHCIIFRISERISIILAYLLTWSVVCQQGATFVPKQLSGRFTLSSLLIMSLLLYNYYTSSIVSSLLSGLPPPFTTIKELANSDLEIGMEDVAYTRTLFEITNNKDIQHLYQHRILPNGNKSSYMNVFDGIARVKLGGFAYHSEPATVYPIIERTFEPHEICELAEINFFTPSVLWIVTQKGGQYSGLFKIGYFRMLEIGIIKRQQSIWIARKPICMANTHLVKVGIQLLEPAFFILVLGMLISLLLLIVEFGIFKYGMWYESSF